MGRYFNTDTEGPIGLHSYATLRLVKQGDGFQVVKGGYLRQLKKGKKLEQYDVLAYCETKEKAEELVAKLITL